MGLSIEKIYFQFEKHAKLLITTIHFILQTCSQLIKTSLKLSLEMKRKVSTSDSSSVDMSICKKIKQDIDSSEDEMIMTKSTRSTICVSIIRSKKIL